MGRVEGTAGATETPIGFMPRPEDIPADGLELRQGQLEECLQIDTEGWIETVNESQRYFEQFGDRLPKQLRDQLETLRQRLLRFQDETTGL